MSIIWIPNIVVKCQKILLQYITKNQIWDACRYIENTQTSGLLGDIIFFEDVTIFLGP